MSSQKFEDFYYDERRNTYLASPESLEKNKELFQEIGQVAYEQRIKSDSQHFKKYVIVKSTIRPENDPKDVMFLYTLSANLSPRGNRFHQVPTFEWALCKIHVFPGNDVTYFKDFSFDESIAYTNFQLETKPSYTEVHIDWIGTSPSWRKIGIAKNLVARINEMFRNAPMAITISTSARTPESRVLFNKSGFFEIKKPLPGIKEDSTHVKITGNGNMRR